MTLFDRLVDQALINQKDYAALRVVVEKELLHHDILRIMSGAGLLHSLTFIGGTCLRACYGSNRLSEDLDFTGGTDFDREMLQYLPEVLKDFLMKKYSLPVKVSKPVKEEGNVDTWKVRIRTRPDEVHLPSQRIHIDICALPSHDRKPRMLRNHYGVEMGTGGLIIQAQSREEILADKFLAFGLRPNRIKNRDLWDIAWLRQSGILLSPEMIKQKLLDYRVDEKIYIENMTLRIASLFSDPSVYIDFKKEMRRFLPFHLVQETIESTDFWNYLSTLINDEWKKLKAGLTGKDPGSRFFI